MRQLLTESILLALLGGAGGVLIAVWGMGFLTTMLSNGQADFTLHATLNWHVLGVTVGLSLLTGVLFGLTPALESTRVSIVPALKRTRPGGAGSRMRPGLSRVLVVSQIALSLLMLVAAGLFARTLANLQAVELGFNRDNVLLFEVDAQKAGYKDSQILTFYDDLRKRFRTVPGVLEASLSHESLIDAGSGLPIFLPGSPRDEATRYLAIGPRFFKTMQIPILAGRETEDRDQPGASDRLATSFFGARLLDRRRPAPLPLEPDLFPHRYWLCRVKHGPATP